MIRYKRSPKSIDQIGRDLGVNYVVEGSVRREAGHLRVNARLITVADQAQAWTETSVSTVARHVALKDIACGRVLSIAPMSTPTPESVTATLGGVPSPVPNAFRHNWRRSGLRDR